MKFINVDEFIKENENSKADTFDLLQKLKDAPSADVIPISYIDRWLKSHYGMYYNPIAKDWSDDLK